MAREKSPQEVAAEAEKKQLQEEKKQLKREQKSQKQETKRRAKEIAKREDALDEEDTSSGVATFFVTLFIVVLWVAVVCVVIKLDVGGFGSSVLTPILQDVPVVNRILPGNSLTETTNGGGYGGYTSLRDAVEQIERLERQLEQVQNESKAKDTDMETLKAEVRRLQPFEEKQVEFQRIRTEFYEEVIYAENGPGAEEYRKYYEDMDPATAEYLYKQVVTQLQKSKEVQDYISAYSQLKPKDAAEIFEAMTDDLNLVAEILDGMPADSRAAVLGAMKADVAAKLTKIMKPRS